jgi:glycerol-3-phosphate dehydrogenase (NAD(P)+)
MKKKITAAVLGAGNLGTAFANIIAENGNKVRLWNWEKEQEPLKQIRQHRENKIYLPGIKLSRNLSAVYLLKDALKGAEMVFLAVPSHAVEQTVQIASAFVEPGSLLVNLSKGFHPTLLLPMSEVIAKNIPRKLRCKIAVISGPAVAVQMANKHATFMNVASKDIKSCIKIKEVVENKFIHIVPVQDLIGVEVCGSFKNVYSILMGICDGMMISLNTKAALITKAVEEMIVVISALGGKKSTAYELAGLGDLLGTAFCEASRNHRFGVYVGRGYKIKDAKTKVRQTVEGINSTKCLASIARSRKLNLPLANTVYSVIFGKGNANKKIEKCIASLR